MSTTLSKQELAYTAIRERILDGTYGPGFRLVIQQLAREFGLSPIPVREAIRRLEAEGLVRYRRHSGPCVAAMDDQAYAETLSVLAVLEGYATALAAPHMQAGDFGQLREVNREMERALTALDPMRFGTLNQEFHRLVYRRCPNQYLVDSIDVCWKRLDQVRHSVFILIPQRGWVSLREHEELVQLMESGAPAEQIEQVARAHKLNTLRAFQTAGRR